MKNNLFYSAMILLSACAFSACNDDKEAETPLAPAVLQGKVYVYDMDEAGLQWQNNQMIGVTMLKANSTELVDPYHNIKYKTTVYPVGYFTPVSSDDVLYYPKDGSNVDIVAYYPYKDNLKDDLYPLNVADQTSAANFSFVYANNSKGLNKDNKKTLMQLRPAFAEFNVKLEAGDGVKDANLINSTIKLIGAPTKANFNLLTGTVQDFTNVQDITLPSFAEGKGNGASGRLLPTTSTIRYQIVITLPEMGGRVQTINVIGLDEMKGGISYTGNVKVSLDKIVFTNITEEPIKDWEENENVVEGSGNQFLIKPISGLALGDLKTSVGNNPFTITSGIPMESWFKAVNGETVLWSAVAQNDAQLHRNVLCLSHTGGAAGWFQSFIGYRMTKAELAKYVVKFRVKGTGKINCFVRTSSGKSPLLTTLAGSKYPTYKTITVTSEYAEYEAIFNFAKAGTSGGGSYLDSEATDAFVSDYDDFYVGFYPTATGATFYLDNVSLTKVKDN